MYNYQVQACFLTLRLCLSGRLCLFCFVMVKALGTLLSVVQGEAAKYAEAAAGGDGEALANGALWVYSIAFDEFRRALATESRDRAEILAAMWDHCFALVQVCTFC